MIVYVAPKWPMLCKTCRKDMGYWVPGMKPEDHQCDSCAGEDLAAACLAAGLAVLRGQA